VNWVRFWFFIGTAVGLLAALPRHWPWTRRAGVLVALVFGTGWLIEVLSDANL
jgi:hypothetical protein